MSGVQRTRDFERKAEQEDILREINDLLGSAERDAFAPSPPAKPLLFVVGAPRSGTTLMMQWLASSGEFAYPTNLLSRFYAAPYVGARIQQLLTDPSLDYRDELAELHAGGVAWTSDVGKTQGILQPHEFFYFWRRFFPVDQAQQLTDEQLAASDPHGFAAGWGSIERAFGKPVATKGILLQYDIRRLAEWLPTAIFIHTRRQPFFNVQSILWARERVLGSRDAWFSARPPEYEWLRNSDPYLQVAGQVEYTNRSIDAELAELAPERAVRVAYEDFCADPAAVWHRLRATLGALGHDLPEDYRGPGGFESTNQVRCSGAEEELIREALTRLPAT